MVDESSPALVLDSECLQVRDVCNSVMGRVKELASLSNLKSAFSNEGFVDFKIRYMGELWVWLEFASANAKTLFLDNVGVNSWFSVLKEGSLDFVPDGRIVWIDVEGVPFKLWSNNTFKRISSKWGLALDTDEQDDTYYHSKRICVLTKSSKTISENFKIIFQGKTFWIRAKEALGWVPDFLDDVEEDESDDDSKGGDFSFDGGNSQDKFEAKDGDPSEEVPDSVFQSKSQHNGSPAGESNGQKVNLSADPFNIYSLLNKKNGKNDENEASEHTPNHPPGFTPNISQNNDIGSAGSHVNETQVEQERSINDKSESVCSGHFKSSSVPRTGGSILGLMEELVKVVYAPHDMRDKILLWDYLTHVTQQWNGDVIIMGDFNEVRLKSDRFGSVFNAHGANLFNTFITNAGLKEVPLGDHRPILLREAHLDYGPTPFRFFHHWMEIDGFDKFVEATWKDAPIHASDAMRGLTFKLKHLKSKLKEWTRGKMNEMNSGKDKFKLELRKLDSDIDSGICSDDVIKKRSEVVQKLLDIDKIQAMEVAQKTKIKWCIEGDENSNFFHGMLNKKRSQLSIRGIMINGVWIEDPLAVKREFYQHFSNRFAKPDSHRALLDMEFPNKISLEKQSELEHEVSREELKQAVWDCGTDKSPGPDGFTFGFFRKFWHLIEEDIFEAVHYFFCHGNIPSGCNSSFITLIPKIPDANLVKDFRPISLIGGIYKIIAKILSNRLVGVLSDIVNEVQSAFIADRQILDGPFILNEVIQWCKLKKKQSFIFKVDFEKAFDSVRWDFLDDVLKNFGFGNKWCRWIQSCLKSSRGSILINGSPTEEF
ncbi:RNA-directed DNA polymerase, eukaryota [Tanacetum coccineum]